MINNHARTLDFRSVLYSIYIVHAYTPYCNIPYRAHNSGTWCLNCSLTFREGISEMRNSNATGFQLLLAYFKTNLTKHVGKHFVPSLSRYHYHLAVWLTVLNSLPVLLALRQAATNYECTVFLKQQLPYYASVLLTKCITRR